MRILILSNIFPPGSIGGYELGAAEIAQGLVAQGHTVEVLTSDFLLDDTNQPGNRRGGFEIVRTLECVEPSRSPIEQVEQCWLGGFLLPRNLRQLSGRLVALRPDAVLCFNLAGLGAPSILRLLVASGVRPVLFMMDNVFSTMCFQPSRRKGFERTFAVADWPAVARFLFMSQTLRHEVGAALGFALPHTQVVPGWFDPAAYAPVEARPPNQPTRFVFVSRIAGHKGVDILLEACRALRDGDSGPFSVDIYGGGEVASLLQRITAMQLGDCLHYRGAPAKSALMPLLSGYDALAFPTWPREPFGFVVPEAAVAGCIPVMTAGVGAAEWFLDGIDCIKMARTAPSLHAAMLHVMTMPQSQRTQMRRRAQRTALRFFRFDDALQRVQAALEEAANPPSRQVRTMEAALAVLTETWRTQRHG